MCGMNGRYNVLQFVWNNRTHKDYIEMINKHHTWERWDLLRKMLHLVNAVYLSIPWYNDFILWFQVGGTPQTHKKHSLDVRQCEVQ